MGVLRGLAALLLWALLWLSVPVASAAATLALSEVQALPLSLDDKVEVLEDPGARLPLEEVARLGAEAPGAFLPGTLARMRRGFSSSAFWLRLTLVNDGDTARPLRLVLNTTWLQFVDFHVQRSGEGTVPAGPWTHEFAGVARSPPMGRAVQRVPTLVLDLGAGEHVRILVRVESRSSVRLVPMLYDEESWRVSESNHALIDGLLIGGLLVLAAYSLAVWMIVRSAALAAQALGFVMVALYEATYRGHARLWFWPDSPEWSYRAAGVVAACCVLNLVLYLHALSRGSPVRPPGLRTLGVLAGVQALMTFGLLWGPYGAFARASMFSALAMVLALTLSSYLYMRRAGPGGRLAYPVMVIVSFGVCLRLAELSVPENALPVVDAYMLGFPGLLVGLAALAAWTHYLSHQRLDAQRKLLQWQAQQQQRLQAEVDRKTRALNAALEQAEHRAREQTRLMAYISHDLRAPLATIVGHARMLRTTLDGAPTQLQAIERSANYQLALVDDLLDYAKGELLPLALDERPARLPALIENIAQYADALAQRQNNRFVLDVQGTLPPAVRLDGKRFQQLLLNLLSNSAKFTRNGQMGLRVDSQPAGERWTLSLEVWDSGIGIHKKDQRRVFRAFTQADRTAGGVGLGLAIAQRIVQHMGGELLLDSRRHLGTRLRFAVTVDLADEDQAPPTPAPAPIPAVSVVADATSADGRPRRHGRPTQAIAPLPARLRDELERLARDGRWSDLHEWADGLAAHTQHAALVKAVRQALEDLDFEHIGQLARVAPSE